MKLVVFPEIEPLLCACSTPFLYIEKKAAAREPGLAVNLTAKLVIVPSIGIIFFLASSLSTGTDGAGVRR